MQRHIVSLITQALIPLAAVFPATLARADIYQWQYINPPDPSQGKQQSATLCPDGAGAIIKPQVFLSSRNLTMADLIQGDLTGATLDASNLTNADLTQATLVNLDFRWGTGDGAIFNQANLTGAALVSTSLTGASFDHANLTNADFAYAKLNGSTLASANLTNADFTGVALNNASLANANLLNSNLAGATLTGANFASALIQNANLSLDLYAGGTGISVPQLQSTASYQLGDLTGVKLDHIDLTGVNFKIKISPALPSAMQT